LDPAFLAAHPVGRVPTWEWEGRTGVAAGGEERDGLVASEVERLRALGYIQ
jgi:hypothetical protein